ncbi:MAG TPA: DUF362 domain-containing protein [Gemmatimonadales bacterium]|nr:DUF362 domain-containing protein [Gemmatimonadales bacterium]
MSARPASPTDYPVALARVTPGPAGYEAAGIAEVLEGLGASLGWADAGGPFGALVPPGARVVVKPNWVMHRNKGPWGLDCLLTHPAVVTAVVDALCRSRAGRITLGDAPLQGCDFPSLIRWGGIDAWAAELGARDPRFHGPLDFRRTRSRLVNGVLVQAEDQLPLSDFVLFDLAGESLLEPVSGERAAFRVTQYDPDRMAATHRPGRHQYLVARVVMEADVVVNLPKLKTHRKAGMTCALKNVVGINGNKEYLPHHRVGGSRDGGDCYPGRSVIKRAHETVLDAQNRATSHGARWLLNFPARALSVMGRVLGDSLGVEGAWSGNDTVWRMCLDLDRILLYGRLDGTLADRPQRRVVSVVDAVVAGQGDGPLAPEPFTLGLLLAGENAAAVDHVCARLLGYDPVRIPLVRESFGSFRWPLAPLGLAAVRAHDLAGRPARLEEFPRPCYYPEGWLDAVERDGRATAPVGRSFRPALMQRLEPQEA